MKNRFLVVGGLVAVVLALILAAGVVWAAEPEGRAGSGLVDYVLRGTVRAVDGERLAVETEAGQTATLLLTDTTQLWIPGERPTTTVSLAVGDPILALGRPGAAESKTLVARLVVIVADEELPKVVVRGQAVAVTEQILVVATGRGERAITVLPRTRLLSPRGQLDTLGDIRPGARVLALGQPTAYGQWIGGLVLVLEAHPRTDNRLRGQVVARDDDNGTLTVETARRGEVLVHTDGRTRYRIPGVAKPGFDDVQVGDTVLVLGRFEAGGRNRFLARGIGLLRPPAEGES